MLEIHAISGTEWDVGSSLKINFTLRNGQRTLSPAHLIELHHLPHVPPRRGR